MKAVAPSRLKFCTLTMLGVPCELFVELLDGDVWIAIERLLQKEIARLVDDACGAAAAARHDAFQDVLTGEDAPTHHAVCGRAGLRSFRGGRWICR
jgi:hypothetical protein